MHKIHKLCLFGTLFLKNEKSLPLLVGQNSQKFKPSNLEEPVLSKFDSIRFSGTSLTTTACISILEIFPSTEKKIFKICSKLDQPKNHFSTESSNILRTQIGFFFVNSSHLGSCFNAP